MNDGRRTPSQHRGSILIVTLWLVSILSVLAIAIGRYLSFEIRLTKYRLAREQTRTLARDGVYLAMQRLDRDAADDQERYDWLQDDWATITPIDLPEGHQLAVEIVDEERKLNLNRVVEDPVMLTAVGTLVESPSLAVKILDYIDSDLEPTSPDGLETDPTAQPPYVAKNGPVVVHEELLNIPGIEEALETLRQSTSVAPSMGKLNINTAAPDVLRALGFSGPAVQALQACREQGTIFKEHSTILTTAETCGLGDAERSLLINEFGVTSQTFTIISRAISEQPAVVVRVETVVQRSPELRILAWREQ